MSKGNTREYTVEEKWQVLKPLYDVVEFDPLEKQKQIIVSEYNQNLFCGGAGAGKSYTSAQYAAPRMLWEPLVGAERTPRYWLVGENFQLPRIELDYIRDWLFLAAERLPQLQPFVVKTDNQPTEGSWVLEIENLCRIETKSWTNPNQLHARPIQGMIVCEAGLMPAWIWHERLKPRLNRVPGSWVLLSGTLEDAETFYTDLVTAAVIEKSRPDWFGVSMATWENTHVYPEGFDDPLIQELRRTTPADIFNERYGAIPKRPAALVYSEFSQAHHVGRFRFDKHRPVYLWIDPSGHYALNAVQQHGDDFHIIDEIHMEPGTTERVIAETVRRPWWKKVAYGVMDATQVEARTIWTSGAIWKTDMLSELLAIPIYHQKVPVEAGIELVRTVLHSGRYEADKTPVEDIWEYQGRPGVARLHVDSRCEYTIHEFSQGYKRKKLLSGQYSDSDVVKRYNHHMDAIRYGLAHMLGFSAPTQRAHRRKRQYVDSRPTAVY